MPTQRNCDLSRARGVQTMDRFALGQAELVEFRRIERPFVRVTSCPEILEIRTSSCSPPDQRVTCDT
jgi:hypothetical protein